MALRHAAFRAGLLGFLFLNGPVCAQPASVADPVRACESTPGAPIRVAGTTLCFSGDIDRDSAEATARLLTERSLTAMVVTSDGGEVTSAVRLARVVRARGLLLVVQRRCISSCANFLFPAARTKAVAPNALVIFHGGIAPGAFGGLFGDGEERDLLSLTRAFFREIGVDGSITYDPPYRRDPRSGVRSLAEEWTATPAALRRHGVTGIVSYWWPSGEAVIREGASQGIQLGIVE
ncbi:MAG: hypothetical protein JNK84_08565 [Phreatobacter sp.]|uniref:hypothetical protein n=1 Tax=Phreatobacter sp. TaxID=1966341 RepID=UPI001A619E89|nr:hypothetical protein [Phreatobacter sp.]MBL8569124.1 hypothetical protein [Phreatobacter sp.]